jgi:2-oxo-4-hydroxy-4-carboxy-5-ureidoimidazoline decarboxylase
MLERRPFAGLDGLLAAADEVWRAAGPADWDEAFDHHPRIGERRAAAAVGAAARDWSAGEQHAATSDESARLSLARANEAYERRFGRIYIVCAAGRSARELLGDIEVRMRNDIGREREVAAEEQRKITRLRLMALTGAADR